MRDKTEEIDVGMEKYGGAVGARNVWRRFDDQRPAGLMQPREGRDASAELPLARRRRLHTSRRPMRIAARLAGAGAVMLTGQALADGGDERMKGGPPVIARLSGHGVTPYLLFTSDLIAVHANGRTARGAATLARAGVGLDLARIAGCQGATMRLGVFLIGGRSPGERESGGLGPISNIQAAPTARVADFYLAQKFFNDRLTVKAGQMSVDESFGFASAAETFVNPTFGWPAINGFNLPGGGPAYPAPAPGLEAAYTLARGWKMQVGVYSGSPWRSEHWNRRGAALSFRHGVFAIAETSWEYELAGLPGALKSGAWRSVPSGHDMRQLELLEGEAARRAGHAFYAVAEQTVWRGAGGGEVQLFGRISRAQASRSPSIDLYADGGVVLKGLAPGRPDDRVALGLAWARTSARAVAMPEDAAPSRRGSALVAEASVRLQLDGQVTLQPFAQYFRLRHGFMEQDADGRRSRSVTVAGLRLQAGF